jgi:hypothetical protein
MSAPVAELACVVGTVSVSEPTDIADPEERPAPSDIRAEPPTAVPPSRSGSRVGIAILLVWAGFVASDLYLVLQYGVNLPFGDDYAVVRQLTGDQPVTWSWLWSTHNEHRLPLPRLVLLGLLRAGGNDFRWAMYVNVLALAIVTLLFLLTAAQLRGRPAWADAFFPLVLLHWGNWENMIWAWQVGFVLSAALASGVLLAAVRTPTSPRMGSAVAVGLCLLLLPLCGATGLAFVPAGALWLGWCGAWTLSMGGTHAQRNGAVTLVLAVLAVALAGAYLAGYRTPPGHRLADVWEGIYAAWQFLSTAPGRGSFGFWPATGSIMAALVGLSFLWLARAWRGQPAERACILGLICYLAGAMCLAAGVGLGRGGLAWGWGLSSRYITLGAPIACAIYLVALRYGDDWLGRRLPAYLALGAAALFIPNMIDGLSRATDRRSLLESFGNDIEAGVPRRFLAEQFSWNSYKIYPDTDVFAEYLALLRGAGIAPFTLLREDPPTRTLALKPAAVTPNGVSLEFQPARPVSAIRFKYALSDDGTRSHLRVQWRDDVGRGSYEPSIPLKAREGTRAAWIDRTVSWLSIELPDACSATISDIELLVPGAAP